MFNTDINANTSVEAKAGSLAAAIAARFQGQRVLILGFGREGRSTYALLRRFFPEQTIWVADQNSVCPDMLAEDESVEYLGGPDYLQTLADYDLIMKSPGVSLKDVDVAPFAARIESQLELLLSVAAEYQLHTVGVTGTKGKSTTSSLIYQILQDQGRPSLLLGNIGVPVFEHLDEITPGMTLVLEMSSHQLEFMHHSPEVAVLLNLYPEHLDHYRSFDAYAVAKSQIYRHQTPQDWFFYSADNEASQGVVRESPPVAQCAGLWFAEETSPTSQLTAKDQEVAAATGSRSAGIPSAFLTKDGHQILFQGEFLYDASAARALPGEYNLRNITFALAVAKVLGLNSARAALSVNRFQTLRHRLELVGEVDGVRYYDNAIGTVPRATIEAIKALNNLPAQAADAVQTVIIGGMDRGVDQQELADFLRASSVEYVICMPDTGYLVAEMLARAGAETKVVRADTLAAAVAAAKELTASGKICLLSPAAASYGAFKNFEDKGDQFAALVRAK